MRRHCLPVTALIASATLLLAGCGKEPPTEVPDAGIDVEAYLGIKIDRCYEYTTAATAQDEPSLGVVARLSSMFVAGGYVIEYSTSGLTMEDYVSVEGNKLQMHKRNFRGVGGTETNYNPPLTLLELPIVPGARQNWTAPAIVRQSGTILSNEEHALTVNIFQPGEIALPLGQRVTGTKMVFEEVPGRSETRTLIPAGGEEEIGGWVHIDFNFSADPAQPRLSYKLQEIRDLTGLVDERACGAAP
jgi:hypothetical protein